MKSKIFIVSLALALSAVLMATGCASSYATSDQVFSLQNQVNSLGVSLNSTQQALASTQQQLQSAQQSLSEVQSEQQQNTYVVSAQPGVVDEPVTVSLSNTHGTTWDQSMQTARPAQAAQPVSPNQSSPQIQHR